MVCKWVEMCVTEGWVHTDLQREISEDKVKGGPVSKMLLEYVPYIKAQLEAIACSEKHWWLRNQVKIIVILGH
jgi:hypothetical protein